MIIISCSNLLISWLNEINSHGIKYLASVFLYLNPTYNIKLQFTLYLTMKAHWSVSTLHLIIEHTISTTMLTCHQCFSISYLLKAFLEKMSLNIFWNANKKALTVVYSAYSHNYMTECLYLICNKIFFECNIVSVVFNSIYSKAVLYVGIPVLWYPQSHFILSRFILFALFMKHDII